MKGTPVLHSKHLGWGPIQLMQGPVPLWHCNITLYSQKDHLYKMKVDGAPSSFFSDRDENC